MMKDDKLNYIKQNNLGNIAQFISLNCKSLEVPRYVHINDFQYEKHYNIRDLVEILINSSNSKSVNIRSYSLDMMKGNPLIYNKNINDIDEIMEILKKNCIEKKYSIVNENIDVSDGGVSGVVLGDIIEFAPEDTPKCVDKNGVCRLPKDIGYNIIETIYGFKPDINFPGNYRVEFSIHPKRQGINKEHTIIWEYEEYNNVDSVSQISWPNKFSQFMGDKTFGLLIADSLGLKVPRTTVISRNVPPFTFGKFTGNLEKWIRTCPVRKEPGKYYTGNSWVDPFKLIENEEKKGNIDEINIASILSQDSVDSLYSGASIIRKNDNHDIIEGVYGNGDNFMIGQENNHNLPTEVIQEVKLLHDNIRKHYNILGEVSIEWVFDGKDVWVVQLNQLNTSGKRDIIVEGNPKDYLNFDINRGLDELRHVIQNIDENMGIQLIGNIGITSHFGDLLRLAKIPSKIKRI